MEKARAVEGGKRGSSGTKDRRKTTEEKHRVGGGGVNGDVDGEVTDLCT